MGAAVALEVSAVDVSAITICPVVISAVQGSPLSSTSSVPSSGSVVSDFQVVLVNATDSGVIRTSDDSSSLLLDIDKCDSGDLAIVEDWGTSMVACGVGLV